MESTDIAMATCNRCGQVFTYEPLMIGTEDFGKLIHTHCEHCAFQVAAEESKRAAEERDAAIEQAIRAQLPPDLLATDPRKPEFNYELWGVVSKWRPGRDEFWLGIIGQAGVCKTRCMALLAQKAMRAGIRVTWTTANRLKDAASDRNHREKTVSLLARDHLEDCKHAAWLFLDDFGKNEWTPAFESQLFQILDHRKNYRLPVVFSSNAHPNEFSQAITALNAKPIIGRLLDRVTIIDLLEN